MVSGPIGGKRQKEMGEENGKGRARKVTDRKKRTILKRG